MSRYNGIAIVLDRPIEIKEIILGIRLFSYKEIVVSFKEDESFYAVKGLKRDLSLDIDVKAKFKDNMYLTIFKERDNTNLSRCISIGQFGYDTQVIFEWLIDDFDIKRKLFEQFDCIKYLLNCTEYYKGEFLEDYVIIDYLKTNNIDLVSHFIM